MDEAQIVDLAASVDGNLASRIGFILEIDKLKSVFRKSYIVDGSRHENTAEHSWHLAMSVVMLAPHADEEIDIGRAIEILLVHDLVEIDAGDVNIYEVEERKKVKAAEQLAAERIFNLLPPSQADYLANLWQEYEDRLTPTAKFAYAVDRLQPIMLNAASGGKAWLENGIRHSQAEAINSPIADGSEMLWTLAAKIFREAASQNLLRDDRQVSADSE